MVFPWHAQPGLWVSWSTVAVGGVGALFTRNSGSGGWPLTFDIDIHFTLLILGIDDVNDVNSSNFSAGFNS